MQGKTSSSTRVTMIHRPMPDECNHSGNVYGGNIMRHMDAAGSMAAERHAGGEVVTAAVGHMSFRSPVKPRELLRLHCSVNAVWRTSMEVGIRTEAEHPWTGQTRHVCTCYLTFVHVIDGKPAPLPPLIPETDEDRRRMGDAVRRMLISRLERNREGKSPCLRFDLLPGAFAICKLPPTAPCPDIFSFTAASMLSLTRSEEDLSLVLAEEAAMDLQRQRMDLDAFHGFACLKVADSSDSHQRGLPASINALLGSAEIPVYTISAFNSSYLLVERKLLGKTLEQLRIAGHFVPATP